MLSQNEIMQTIQMIDQQHLDVRTITMGISLLSCAHSDAETACGKIYDKITRYAEKLVSTGEAIEKEFGIPIVNKRISVTPIALVAAAAETEDYVPFARTLDRAAKACGVDFIGGFSALVQKGMTDADRKLIASIPQALAETDIVCSSVNVGSTKAGIDMDAVAIMGRIIKELAARTADRGGFGCAKLVVFCNAVEDNPFMAGAFHGVGEPERVINVGVSGPGVVHYALQSVKGQPFDVVAETIKKTAFRITRMGQLVAQEASRRLDTPFGIVDLSLAPTPAEKGRRHGLLVGGRPLRGLHSCQRGRGDDCRRVLRGADAGQAGGHDLCVLSGTGHDRGSRRHRGGDHFRHNCRRGCHRHGQCQDHCCARDPCSRTEGRGYGGVRRTAGLRTSASGSSLLQQGLCDPRRPDSCADAEP